jgi:hypothetical protein
MRVAGLREHLGECGLVLVDRRRRLDLRQRGDERRVPIDVAVREVRMKELRFRPQPRGPDDALGAVGHLLRVRAPCQQRDDDDRSPHRRCMLPSRRDLCGFVAS